MRDTIKQWSSHPNADSNFTERSQQREISPPPLKRRRTAYEESRRGQDPVSLATLGTSKSLPKPEFCKPACRVCGKTTATSYNPVIACPGCARPYHDSCRRPLLPQGVDPQQWRCSACSNRSGKPPKPMLLSKSVPVRNPVVVKDIFTPPYAQGSITDLGRSSNGTAPSKRVFVQTFRASNTNARSLGSLDRPKEDIESSLQSDRSENLRTAARCSTQSLHPESSSQQHHVQAQTGLSVPRTSIRVQSRTSIVSCSDCRQASIVVRPGDENPRCQSCRRESRVRVRRSEIPETPNAGTPCDIRPLTSSTESTASLIANGSTAGSSSWIDPNRTSTLTHTYTEPPCKEQQREKDDWRLGTPEATYNKEETQIRLSPRCPHVPFTDDATARISYPQQQEPRNTSLESSPKTGNSLVPLNVSTSPEVDDVNLYTRQRRHSNRELARIALACANGSSMSAPRIIDWLVRRFPYLEQGQAPWEKSLKATLSHKEFRSSRATGLDDARVVYSFVNEAYKTQFEAEYRDYITHYSHEEMQQQVPRPGLVHSTGHVCETIESIPEQHSSGHLGQATQDATARDAKDTWGNTLKRVGSSQQSATSFIPSPESSSCDDNTLPRTFSAPKPSLARNRAEYATGIKRETSFSKAYPRSIRTSLEMMTVEEKAKKVAEIRARPSRKQLIDSGQRLAHVRRYRRQDIHDESDGAWKPQSVEAKEKPMEDADECDEPRSLREVFRLPANAIPMLHEGNELAFRDGTMVNGRLPRPRRIYRVGKRLGAGLTVN